MNSFLKISGIVFVMVLWQAQLCYAQSKKKANNNKAEQTAAPKQTKAKDTTAIIYERIPAKPRTTGEVMEPIYKTKEVIIDAGGDKKGKQAIKKDVAIVYDTLHNKPKKRLGQEIIEEDRKTVVIEMSKPGKDNAGSKEKPPEVIIVEGSCKCVTMELKAQDTISYDDYINYRFIFTNKCKQEVQIHSGSFRFVVNDYFGHPVTRLRKVDFVKRFDYPEYVRVSPGETYEFSFADDPFFEYKMNRAQQYRFSFMYNNTGSLPGKGTAMPQHPHQCLEVREKVVFVR